MWNDIEMNKTWSLPPRHLKSNRERTYQKQQKTVVKVSQRAKGQRNGFVKEKSRWGFRDLVGFQQTKQSKNKFHGGYSRWKEQHKLKSGREKP